MLGKTAGGLYWMFRYLERSENIARLVDAGFRIALTRSSEAEAEWASIISTAGVRDAYLHNHGQFDAEGVTHYLLRERSNKSSVMSSIDAARNNARLVRTALTREIWEATNECWITLKDLLSKPVRERDLPDVLGTIRRQNALVRGALYGTMTRNDIFSFANAGIHIERADNTARLLDVKYYVLLPSLSFVGTSLDNVQWETILRAASAHRAYHWLKGEEVNPNGISELLILDRRLPRSLAFCARQLKENLNALGQEYDMRHPCHGMADTLDSRLASQGIQSVFDSGLHDFLIDFIRQNNAIGSQIEQDYRFNE